MGTEELEYDGPVYDEKIYFYLIMAVLILIALFGGFIIHDMNKTSYVFVIDGEELSEIVECQNEWAYDEQNVSFLPCIQGNQTIVLPKEMIFKQFSPIDNCKFYNASFPGFNLINETKAKEMYDSLIPKCWTIKDSDIDEEFLSGFNCTETNKKYECITWVKEGLEIKKK